MSVANFWQVVSRVRQVSDISLICSSVYVSLKNQELRNYSFTRRHLPADVPTDLLACARRLRAGSLCLAAASILLMRLSERKFLWASWTSRYRCAFLFRSHSSALITLWTVWRPTFEPGISIPRESRCAVSNVGKCKHQMAKVTHSLAIQCIFQEEYHFRRYDRECGDRFSAGIQLWKRELSFLPPSNICTNIFPVMLLCGSICKCFFVNSVANIIRRELESLKFVVHGSRQRWCNRCNGKGKWHWFRHVESLHNWQRKVEGSWGDFRPFFKSRRHIRMVGLDRWSLCGQNMNGT